MTDHDFARDASKSKLHLGRVELVETRVSIICLLDGELSVYLLVI